VLKSPFACLVGDFQYLPQAAMARRILLLLGCLVSHCLAINKTQPWVQGDGTDITAKFNARIAPSPNGGVYSGGQNLGLMIRNINDGLKDDQSKKVVPATFLHNDIVVPSIAYPNGNPMCPENGWNGYRHGNACQDDPWKNAVVLAVIGSGMNALFKDASNMQNTNWGWGVFYGTDSNSADKRCRWLSSSNGWSCPGWWVDQSGSQHRDSNQGGSGAFPAGNPGAPGGGGGGAGCHWTDNPASMDQFDADGTNLVSNQDCECNYALKGNGWEDWVKQWILHGKAKSSSSWEGWFAGGTKKAPGWAVDLAACWVNNPRDMIYIQNMVYFYRFSWNNQLVPRSQWDANKPETQRYYWGWNEIPVDRIAVNAAANFDAVAIKLPAAICPGTDGGRDSVKCLEPQAQNDLQDQLYWYVQNQLLRLGENNMKYRPGSYVVFLREWQKTTQQTGLWQRYFFCESFNWNRYQVVFKAGTANGACYLDKGSGPAPTPPPPPPTTTPPPPCGGSTRGLFQVDRDRSKCLDIAGGKVYNGAVLQIWNCNGHPNQNFRWCGDGRIVSDMDTNFCVDVPGGDPSGTGPLQMWSCNSHAGQYWKYDGNTMAVYPASAGEKECIDLENGSTNPGTGVILWGCQGGNNERWYTLPVARNSTTATSQPDVVV
jgi:hypothetical protein